MTNPYSAPPNTNASTPRKSRILRSALILNATLIGVPMAIGAIPYLWAYLSAAWEAATSNGDPVAFHHFYYFYSVQINSWFAIAFVLIPNVLLFVTHYGWIAFVRDGANESCKSHQSDAT